MHFRREVFVIGLLLVTAATVHAAGDTRRIIPRSEWGAEVKYLYDGTSTEEKSVGDTGKGDTAPPSNQTTTRVDTCQQAIKNHPAEFAVAKTVTKDAGGKKYRWPLTYSKEIKLLVVHHTALLVRDDPRPPQERMRALYKYHALSNGWGDIGYHFVIDEEGTIYEGRQGGTRVVGGHAYCNNVGTVGIALMGNFELEQPSQSQAKSLQWLLAKLAKEEGIDVSRSLQFHGQTYAHPIVGHQDLLATACPGGVLKAGFPQIIRNVITGSVDASVVFPSVKKPTSSSSASSAASSSPSAPRGLAPGIGFLGRTAMTMNPGGKQVFSFTYTAGESGAYEGKKIADVRLGAADMRLFVDDGFSLTEVKTGIALPFDIPAGETATIRLILQAPINPGEYSLDIGGQRFTVAISGRRARTGTFVSPFYTNPAHIVQPTAPKKNPIVIRHREPINKAQSSSRSSSSASASSSVSSAPTGASTPDSSSMRPIRIRLSVSESPVVSFSGKGTINGVSVPAGASFDVSVNGTQCVIRRFGERVLAASVVRLQSDTANILRVSPVQGKERMFGGTLECRVIGGKIALINELPLEDYIRGLAESPDTEPFEKQKAIAIAARTYAAFYMHDANRKYPGMPYDGSDDPASFQLYAGVGFGAYHPRWLQAADATRGQVLTYQNSLFKPAYFSSDDGRTRSPEEAGWKNFPAAEIFTSKPDPWCAGMTMRGHGVGMSGCGAKGQALEGRSAEQILQYYYPGARLSAW